jgi:hypothetical protein
LAGVDAKEQPIAMWFTQRLLLGLLPLLLKWLEKQVQASEPQGAEIVQSFAQEAALAALKPQPPVITGSPEWLVSAIDVKRSNTRATLTFRGESDQSVSISFTAKELRQWLSILQRAWGKAGWPKEVWPAWMKSDTSPRGKVRVH